MSLDYLEKKNAHERDSHITFDEGPHIYTIDGDSSFTSVTTWNHSHFEHFDADAIIDKMMRSPNWQLGHKYYGKTADEIKAGWDKNRDEAASAGTKMHYDIECYYNNMDVVNDSIEYSYFKNYLESYGHLKPYRTEWMVYHEDLKLAGSIDMVYECDDGSGELLIYDWKRCREIKKASAFEKFANKQCIEHIPDTNYWHYCLQLNTYKAIIEENYGKKVRELYLVCLHPDNKNYQRIKVANLQNEVKELFQLRKNSLNT